MNNESTDKESQTFTDRDIFTKIWTSPREVFKFIHENQYDKHVGILLFFAGISRALNRAALRGLGDRSSLFAILALSIIVGGLFGWITYYFYAFLLSWTGKWIDGQGDSKSILRIMAYAMFPGLIALLLKIPQIAVYGNEMFKSDGDITSAGILANSIVYSSMFLEIIFGLMSVVFIVIGLSEVQKLSIGKSILNLILPIILILSVLVSLGILFATFSMI